jgi:Predicted oxidoreductases (related to aryl-alcohol dehydrogenases)
MGRRDAAGGDAGGSRQPGPARARALHRLLELFRLACDEGARISEREHRQRFVSQQIHYTLEAREAEYELLPLAIDQGLGILVWSPLAGGLLSGKHRRNQKTPKGTRQLAGWTEPPIRDENRLWNIVDALVAIGEAHGVSAAQVALVWLLGRPGITSLVIGGRTEAQLKDNLAAAALVLTPKERQRLDEVSQPPLLYPYGTSAIR